jgi:hypothetical protein
MAGVAANIPEVMAAQSGAAARRQRLPRPAHRWKLAPDITGTYEVDGLSSTGIFAGARGTGSDTVDTRTHTAVLSGKLKLAGEQ